MVQADVVVIGGGIIGSAIAYGLRSLGCDVVLLDEGDVALRAARGNFGLVWVQGKGLGMRRYAEWARQSADLWPAFADELHARSGIDVAYRKDGGLMLCLGEDELNRRRWELAQLTHQAGPDGYDCTLLDRQQVQELIPDAPLGDEVSGGSYSPHDGDCNPLRLLNAVHHAFRAVGGQYRPDHRAETITREDDGFTVTANRTVFRAAKLVLAAGHGITHLAPQIGLQVPIHPERGQVLVTERVRPFLRLPINGIRQTDEGTIMLGSSAEDVGFDERTTADTMRHIADRNLRALPCLRHLRLNRVWGALRVLTPDDFPVYEQSVSHPGAYVATSHSGVSLAAIHAGPVARWIADGEEPSEFNQFSTKRFHVSGTA